jgi:hypothetical protein
MPITTREARQLVSTAERSLFESSLPAAARALSPSRLKSKIARARTLRDKYRDLSKRQHRKAQPGRSGRPGERLNIRTKRKAELFTEVLARLDAEATRRSRKPQTTRTSGGTATRRKGARKSKTSVAPVSGASPAPPSKVKRTLAPLVPKSAVAQRSGQHRIHAHVSSAARRRQGRRDSR